jgi:vitamin B12 transporter
LDASCEITAKARANLSVVYTGRSPDYDYSSGSPVLVDLAPHTLVSLAGSYDLTKRIQLFARVENLLDENYTEVFGYGTPGIAAYGGLKASF